MAQEHDSWLSGLGIDVGKILTSLGPTAQVEGPSGESRVGGDGSQSGKGRLMRADDGQGGSTDYFSGEYDSKPDGSGSLKGTLAKKTSMDGAVVETTGEVELSNGKVAVTAKKTEVDVAKLAGDSLPEGTVLKFDMGGGTASAEQSFRDDGLAVGLQANAGEGSITVGTQNAKSDTDETTRFGLSEGEGAAGRVHWGDADKDGNPEYGFGADIGPVSFDVKTEDPMRTAITRGVDSVIPGLGRIADQSGLLGKENLTKKAKREAADTYDAARQKVGEAVGDAKQKVNEAVDNAKRQMNEAVDNAKQQMNEAVDNAKEQVNEAVDNAKERTSQAIDDARETIGEVKEEAGAAIDSAKDAAGQALEDAKDGIIDGLSSLIP